ncbi:helix-turn-helix protein [Aneurinibacillus soli]|uniref:Helix-turn-helix domain protein n=1 Tax=Aneurinibacillus soli TaxID=1500254 RepID=A0A0U4NIH2_9BACL|nr:helix-turn-helix domain-containing protein [Aneurinibacillus soli]PYE62263.1 helix-turn-helix protein [Aneurinibacillus soli]BAU28548.1 Helix-turn-helix domain protein [Aneurinibacillus soli]
MVKHKGFKFRIYPNEEQAILINKSIGCVRYVFNHFLAKRKEVYETDQKTLSYKAFSALLTKLKKEIVWLKEPDSTALQNALQDLDEAYQKFFKEKTGYPKFKSRKNRRQSYNTTNNKDAIRIEGTHIRLPIKEVQKRNEQIAQLNQQVADLNSKLSSTTDEKQKEELRKQIASLKSQIDSVGNAQQMDMLRLQSLSNKRNEAFDTMTNFVKKMQDSRNSIIGNMR